MPAACSDFLTSSEADRRANRAEQIGGDSRPICPRPSEPSSHFGSKQVHSSGTGGFLYKSTSCGTKYTPCPPRRAQRASHLCATAATLLGGSCSRSDGCP